MAISKIETASLDTGLVAPTATALTTASGSAPSYSARAWVNFNGSANTNLGGTYSQSGTTVTVTATAHELLAGSVIYSDITSGTGVDGTYTVTAITNANTFTYTAGTSLTTSGNINLIRNTIRASGNVSSVADLAIGSYDVNFTTAMPDANSCVVVTSKPMDTGAVVATACLGYYNNATNPISAYSVRVLSIGSTGATVDLPFINVAVFR